MKLVRMFCIASVAAVAAMAFVGASSALAESSLLCSNDTPTQTPTAAECNAPAEVHYVTNGHAQLLTNVGITVECNVLVGGTQLGLVTNGPVLVDVPATSLVYSNCLGGCTVTTVKGGTIKALKEGVELATLTAEGFEVKVVCAGLINCKYTAEGLVGHGLGPLVTGDNGHVTYTAKPVSGTGLLCPTTANLDALFISLTPVYIRS